MDGVSKPGGATHVDIDSLSDLLQVHWCTGSVLAASLVPPNQAGGATAWLLKGCPETGEGGWQGELYWILVLCCPQGLLISSC